MSGKCVDGNNLVYEVIYYNENIHWSEYYTINGRQKLLFNEVISINPHNIQIISVCVKWSIILYDYESSAYNNICSIRASVLGDIIEEGDYTPNQVAEVFHLIDLWLTKFVPHTSS